MSAPYFVAASTGSTDPSGAWEHTFNFTPAADDLVIVQILQDGGTHTDLNIYTLSYVNDVDGVGSPLYLGTFGEGSSNSPTQHILIGRATGTGAPYVSGANLGSEDVYIRGYTFRGWNTDAASLREVLDWGSSRAMRHWPLVSGGKLNGRKAWSWHTDGSTVVVGTDEGYVYYRTGSPRSVSAQVQWSNSQHGNTSAVRGVTKHGAYWVAVDDTGYICTANVLGGTWTVRAGPVGNAFRSVASDGTYCIAVGANNTMYWATSVTGTWTQVDPGFISTDAILRIRKVGGYWFAVGDDTSYMRICSGDPTSAGNWSTPSSGGFTGAVWDVAYNGTYYLAGQYGTYCRYTTDPTGTWSASTGPTSVGVLSVDGTTFIAGTFGYIGSYYFTDDPSGSWTTYNLNGNLTSGSTPTDIFTFDGDLWAGAYDGIHVETPTSITVDTAATIGDAAVTTSSPETLALQLVGVSDDNAVDSFTGETGGNWIEADAEYASSSGTDGCIQLQIARPSAVPTSHRDITGARTVGSTFYEQVAQSFYNTSATTVTGILVPVSIGAGSPSDNLVAAIYSDYLGSPNNIVGTSDSIAAADLTSARQWLRFDVSASLSAITRYWVVLKRSGSLSDSNYFGWAYEGIDEVSGQEWQYYNDGTWGVPTGGAYDLPMAVLTATEDAGSTIDGGSYTMAASDRWSVVGFALKGLAPPVVLERAPLPTYNRKVLQAIKRSSVF